MINDIVIKVSGKTIGVLSDMKVSNKTYDKVYELKAEEEWRQTEFPMYEVSNLGRVRSWRNQVGNRRSEPRIIKPWQSGRKYKNGKRSGLQIVICTNHGHIKKKVHHLVLETFVSLRPTEGHESAHLDGDILNNRLDNLKWVTHIENENHKKEHGTLLRGEKATCVKLNEEQVREIKQLLREGKLSHNMIAKRYDVSRRAITNINTGLSWRHVK